MPETSTFRKKNQQFNNFLLTGATFRNNRQHISNASPAMIITEIDLRDLPADVQDILRDRAIREHRPMAEVLKDYVLESARLIIAASAPEGRAA